MRVMCSVFNVLSSWSNQFISTAAVKSKTWNRWHKLYNTES